ncbi:MAG TPA: BREX system ATP-binding protein BrxD [Propioniciclava tarda]|nr:BREX system ATP-binding protein BrxD [Propioniciclava tarda]
MSLVEVSVRRRREVIDALRRGTVPESGLDLLAVGLDRFETALSAELDTVAGGGAVFKAVRGEYGSGKTFFTRHLAERALKRGFATAEVQISETQTPLHRLETVYRRVTESMRTASIAPSAFRAVLDSWLFTIESDAMTADPALETASEVEVTRAVERLLEERLAAVSSRTPVFAQALRGYRSAVLAGDGQAADALVAWMGGQPQVAASAKRAAGIRGDLDHFGAMAFLQGLLTVLRDAGHPGLVLVLDEVETLQRVRGDVRDKALNAMRQLIDEVDAGRYPGLYLLVTGTPAFFDGPSGIPRLPPLAQRLTTDFATDARFDNPRAVQIRLPGFTHDSLVALGQRVRDLYADGSEHGERVRAVVDDPYVGTLADAVTGQMGGRVGVAPRLYLKKLVADVLDRVDQFLDFDPRVHYALTVGVAELSDVERALAGSGGADGLNAIDDIVIDVDDVDPA